MPHASGSGLALLRSCRWWAREDLPPLPPEEVGRAAVVGTAAHARIAATLGLAEPLLDGLTEDERATVDAQTARAVNWITSRGLARLLTPEVAYAWDVQGGKARRILPRHPRDYSEVDRVTEIPCTIDAIAPLNLQSALVIDWKTGRAAHVETPRDNAQLLLGALCARSIYGVSEVEIGIVYLGDGSEAARYVSAVVTDLELDAFAEELRRLWGSVATAPAVSGPHCTERYCKRLGQCPATAATLLEVGQPDVVDRYPVVVDARAIVSREHAAWLLRAAKLASAVASKAESAVREYTTVLGGALDLGDGRVYCTEPGYARLDTAVALPVLRDEGLDLDLAAPRSVSRDSIGEAVKATGKPVAPAVKRVLARIEAEGGLTRGAERWTTRKI